MPPPIGTCPLCLRPEQELQSSHLLPAGIYKALGEGTGQAVKMTPATTVLTSHQLQAQLLCRECEARFERGGEGWTIPRLWKAGGTFRLREILAAGEPAGQRNDLRVYLGHGVPGFEVDRLVYFAASVFWRAGARRWNDGPDEHHIELGPYMEPLRRFLMGESPFPDGMTMSILLTSKDDAPGNQIVSPPALRGRTTSYRRYQFDVPGVRFALYVGKELPAENVRTCAARTGIVSETTFVDRWRIEDAFKLLKTTERKGKLAKSTE